MKSETYCTVCGCPIEENKKNYKNNICDHCYQFIIFQNASGQDRKHQNIEIIE